MTALPDMTALEPQATAAAALLRAMAHEKRLLILCRLLQGGEATAGALVAASGLSQSALSQHLARMREDGLVTYRREAQTLWYRIADPNAARLVDTLYAIFCGPDAPAQAASPETLTPRETR